MEKTGVCGVKCLFAAVIDGTDPLFEHTVKNRRIGEKRQDVTAII
jgi:hypothetical protein